MFAYTSAYNGVITTTGAIQLCILQALPWASGGHKVYLNPSGIVYSA